MRAVEIELTNQQRAALVAELRSYDPAIDCICCTDAELVRDVERARARNRDDRERS